MRSKTVAVAVALVLVSAAASAQEYIGWMSGNELKRFCHGDLAVDQPICLGFALAVAGIVATNEPVYGFRACVPDGVTVGQLTDIITKHLNDHPEYLRLTATSLAVEAFAIAFPFPCPK